MNETEWIFLAIAAFGIGYGIAYLAKNIGSMADRWGIFSIFLIPVIVIILLVGAGVITDLKNVSLSLSLAVGFVFRMIRR